MSETLSTDALNMLRACAMDGHEMEIVLRSVRTQWGEHNLTEFEIQLVVQLRVDRISVNEYFKELRHYSVDTTRYAYMCAIAIHIKHHVIKYVDFKAVGYASLCELSVYADPRNIEYVASNAVPNSLYDKLCLFAVSSDFRMLEYCREPSDEVCRAAIKNNPRAIQYLTSDQQTAELCMMAVQKNPTILNLIMVLTPELCIAAIRGNSRVMSTVRTTVDFHLNICPKLVAEFGSDILDDLTGDMGTIECSREVREQIRIGIVRAATDGRAILYFWRQTPQLCVEAYRTSSLALDYIVDADNCRAVARAAAADKLVPLAPLRLAASLQTEVFARLFEKKPTRLIWPGGGWHTFVYLLGWKVGMAVLKSLSRAV